MVTHFSILAWKFSWTEEPGGLQSIGWQRVRQPWMTNTSLQAECETRNSSAGTLFGGGGQGKRRQALKFVCSSKLPLQAIRVSHHPGGELTSLWGQSSEACLPGEGAKEFILPATIGWEKQEGINRAWWACGLQKPEKPTASMMCPGVEHSQPTKTWQGLKGEGWLQECLEGGERVGEEKHSMWPRDAHAWGKFS